jgi:hypothetical protein
MTGNAPLAVLAIAALASGVSPARAVTSFSPHAGYNLGDPTPVVRNFGGAGQDPITLDRITSKALLWDMDEGVAKVAGGAGFTNPSGAGNAGPTPVAVVPEPASWALLVVGFGGLGATLRRRRAGQGLAEDQGQALKTP